ncbi:MAG: O-acetyl-ADP-ribose deacetylase [Nitrososphaerota archaeon]|jgi:O-acetyl-ADP-ribose deacetylase (regulator of RNase III)|nr:O-acetyl-ADP-ribose deacetylase [Nitrososphaerota archaeon]
MFEFKVGSAVVQLKMGDITDMDTDVIVNAANSSLLGGLGVDGAIHSRGGVKILEECKRIRASVWPDGLPTGYAVITLGGNLAAKHVIHTVGPIWHGGLQGEDALLKQAYRNSLKLAESRGLKTIAFPSISTGAYGYPIEEASQVALKTIKNFLEKETINIEKVVMVLFTEPTFSAYLTTAKQIF